MPAGITLSSAGAITGSPSTAGTASFTVTVKDANNLTATQNLSITINAALSITTMTLTNGVVGAAYNQTLAASGGTPPYSNWTVATGSLPVGLTLSAATGAITGTPTGSAGTSNFTVTVKDTANTTATSSPLSITVTAGLTITTTHCLMAK